MSQDPDPAQVDIGETVYDRDGNRLGTVRGVTEHGLFVTTQEGIEALSIQHERAGHEFGQAELTWRCLECGAVGDIDDFPDSCPDCGARREHIYYWIED